MKRIRNLAAVAVAVMALVVAPLPASAATTNIHRDTAVGALYSGNVRATLIQPVSVTTTLGTATCNTGNIDANVQSNGTALNVTAFSFSNTPGPACPNSIGGSSTVTPVGLSWLGGDVVFATGGGTVTIRNLKVSSVTTGWFGTLTCVYRGSGTGNSLTLTAYNPDNPARPVTTVNEAQARANGASLTKDSGSLLCPSSATFSATFKLLGEKVAGSGTYDQTLYLTS
ncbi:hypothetical protein GCM10010517_66080 [Streptosporangium fragile]|uniref:Ig-like domain-containing protein n=1 Tax=Streptosporangium fragile TaxID=46186 RepID=A0ABN3W716_9ACTN